MTTEYTAHKDARGITRLHHPDTRSYTLKLAGLLAPQDIQDMLLALGTKLHAAEWHQLDSWDES